MDEQSMFGPASTVLGKPMASNVKFEDLPVFIVDQEASDKTLEIK